MRGADEAWRKESVSQSCDTGGSRAGRRKSNPLWVVAQAAPRQDIANFHGGASAPRGRGDGPLVSVVASALHPRARQDSAINTALGGGPAALGMRRRGVAWAALRLSALDAAAPRRCTEHVHTQEQTNTARVQRQQKRSKNALAEVGRRRPACSRTFCPERLPRSTRGLRNAVASGGNFGSMPVPRRVRLGSQGPSCCPAVRRAQCAGRRVPSLAPRS